MSAKTDQDFRIDGFVAPGFEPVRDAFVENVRTRKEVGAACAAYVSGQLVVDLWGGVRIPGTQTPWQDDTMIMVMSTTKGLAALAAAVAHSKGYLDYDSPVSRYWPEFGQAGKADITVRQLLAHQAGLSAPDTELTIELMSDEAALCVMLERQVPSSQPGARHGYHSVSLGLYLGQLMRRVDPMGRSLGQFFKDEIANPLGIADDLHIGLPNSVGNGRLADALAKPSFKAMRRLPWSAIWPLFNPKSLPSRTLKNPNVKPADLFSRPFYSIEVPSFNAVGTPRAIAKAYSEFAAGGKTLGIQDETLTQLEARSVPPSGGAVDAVMGVEFAYSLGFCKPFPHFNFSTSDRAFGTMGAGGSQGFADPETELGFAYAPNRLAMGVLDDDRAVCLRDAVYRCAKLQS